jgi:hypothetical protein
MAKAAKKTKRGYVGLFGRRTGATIWISGFVGAAEFRHAGLVLAELYRMVNGHRPKRVTKTDVMEFALMSTRAGSDAYDRLKELRAKSLEAAERRKADAEYFRSGTRYPGQ